MQVVDYNANINSSFISPQHLYCFIYIYKSFVAIDKKYQFQIFKMIRNRSISNINGNKPTKRPSLPSESTQKKKVNKVPYYYNKCNGKLVLNQTKLFHESASGSLPICGGFA